MHGQQISKFGTSRCSRHSQYTDCTIPALNIKNCLRVDSHFSLTFVKSILVSTVTAVTILADNCNWLIIVIVENL